jgi:hypothetical protein
MHARETLANLGQGCFSSSAHDVGEREVLVWRHINSFQDAI